MQIITISIESVFCYKSANLDNYDEIKNRRAPFFDVLRLVLKKIFR